MRAMNPLYSGRSASLPALGTCGALVSTLLLAGCASQGASSSTQIVTAPDKDARASASKPSAADSNPHAGGHHGAAQAPAPSASTPGNPSLEPQEIHLKNLFQLTKGGENAEGYFSFDGKRLSFQARWNNAPYDRIYTMNIDGTDIKPVSSGVGSTTCSYYTPDGKSVVYASTHHLEQSPIKPDMSQGYVWAIWDSYDIFKQNLETGQITQLTNTPGYDAEATISPDGKTIVFTSVRDGDLELYSMDLDGKNVKRLTHTPGYDGGAFFSHDSQKLVWRASRPQGEELKSFQELLKQAKVRPSKLEIYVGNADGTNARQITSNGAANFAPFYLPDDSGVVFVSNMADPRGRDFDVYAIKLDGSSLTRITFNPTFDGFPMFSPDGKKIVFSSNRGGTQRGETNLFIADWVW